MGGKVVEGGWKIFRYLPTCNASILKSLEADRAFVEEADLVGGDVEVAVDVPRDEVVEFGGAQEWPWIQFVVKDKPDEIVLTQLMLSQRGVLIIKNAMAAQQMC